MKPVRPVGHNWTYKPPPGTEEAIGSLEVRRKVKTGQAPEIHSAWRPRDEELAVLNMGGTIEVGVYGMMPPPPISVNVAGPACDDCGQEAVWDDTAKAFFCAHPEHDRQVGLGEKPDRPDPYPG